MPYKPLRLLYEGEVATLTLNRPEKRNALSREMIEELGAAFSDVESSRARALILAGTGKAFCSGMDLNYLKEFPAQSPEQIVEDTRRIANMFRRLWSFPKPVVAAVNSPAIAGGTGLATLCDFTLASPDTTFRYTEVPIGFIPA